MAKRLIFSDLHFGDPLCSLRRELVTTGLRQFLQKLKHVDEVILAGDILDVNIASLTQAIEGVTGLEPWPKQIGFRAWLAFLFDGLKFNVNRIVYIPGNHDYIIWNILATDKAFIQPISQGQIPQNLPLMKGVFSDAFIRGVFPKPLRERVVVVYPDYEFNLCGRNIFVTHGHYLDDQQTLFKNLQEMINEANGDEAKAVRKFFIGTAQYQAVANAVSYMKGMRKFVYRAHKTLAKLLDKVDVIGKIRNQPINKRMVRAIEIYLRYFSDTKPDVFIFGHTHMEYRLFY
jgi:predicted phosphodiesterase